MGFVSTGTGVRSGRVYPVNPVSVGTGVGGLIIIIWVGAVVKGVVTASGGVSVIVAGVLIIFLGGVVVHPAARTNEIRTKAAKYFIVCNPR